ncbi:site-specific integrase [Aeromonas bestiarum]|uniref:tyrosine-type recombinase/integrase n=1 Tax=Aeromonas bestiarum TaxID=105751 RepID=UPI000CD3D633|nr:site-specific integrase [Aeromonas bestiarum]POG21239.1 site-specific integrase [Aeromonas bestiarum]
MAKIRKVTGKKGTTYRVQFMRNGKRVDRSFPRKKDAEQFLAQLIVSDDLADTLTHVTLTGTTIKQAIREYLDQYTGRDDSAIQRLNWWADRLDDKPLGKVTRQHVKAALNTLESEGKAPATLNRYKAALSSVFVYMNDQHDIKHNPAQEVRQKTEDNARTRFLSDDELPWLLAAAKASKWERLHLLVSMAIFTGARRSELIGLKWSHIDLNARTAHLHHTKNGTERVLTLPPALVQEMMKFRQVGNAYLFPHSSKLNAPFEHFDCFWQACRNEAGITDFHFHDLRHTCASLLAKNGASLLEIAQVLGHKSITSTQRYAHLCNGHKQSLTDRVFGVITL